MNLQERSPETAPPPADAARDKLVIGILLFSAFVVILNETVMAVAIPHLMHDLGITATAAQWLTTAFLLTMAVCIPVTGFLLQRLNTRPVFLLAMSTFSLGTLVCALSPGLPMLVAGRVVQAAGTAIMMPLLMTTIMTLVPPENRGRTMGNISIVMSVAPAIGPTLSGAILSVLTWRWLFLAVLPIALGALVLGALRIKNVSTTRYAPLDFLSVVLSLAGFGGLVYGLSNFGSPAASFLTGGVSLGVGVVALAAFIARQLALQGENRAFLDLRTFRTPTFAVAVAMMAVCMMALFGMLILLPLFMQHVLGLDTLKTGLLLLPGGLVMGLASRSIGHAYDRHGPRPLVVPGTILVSAVMWGMTLGLSEHFPFAWLLVAHVVLSVGLAMTFTPLFSASLGSLKPELYSHGSAAIGSIQQVAGAAGTALFVALMARGTAERVAQGLSEPAAMAGGIRVAFFCGALFSLLAVAGAFFVKRPAPMAPPAAEPAGA